MNESLCLEQGTPKGSLTLIPPVPLYLPYVTKIPRSHQLFARKCHQEQAALQYYQLYALSRSPSPNLSPKEIYEAVDDFICSVAYATNQHLVTAPAFRQYPLIRILEDYQGHALDVIQGDDPRPTRLPRRSSCPKKNAKPHAQL